MDSVNAYGARPETSSEEVDLFFESAPPLKNSAEINDKLNKFIERNSGTGKARRIVCVTSGGTTVPLEQRCVRYIDNFSSGNRGAASTEYFVKAGYAVIFLNRRGTCQPYCRSLPDDPLLECFEYSDETNIRANQSYVEPLKTAIFGHNDAVSGGLLLKLNFTTIFEYLQMLEMIALSMRALGPHAMFYLASAVSDFYLPWKSMAEHKIQSACGPFNLQLEQVPKMLGVLRKDWAPLAFSISFKLETDTKILLHKASAALKKYKMHLVVANELSTRNEVVEVVSSDGNILVRHDQNQVDCVELENPLIQLIVERHSAYIAEPIHNL